MPVVPSRLRATTSLTSGTPRHTRIGAVAIAISITIAGCSDDGSTTNDSTTTAAIESSTTGAESTTTSLSSEAGKLVIEKHEFDLDELFDTVASQLGEKVASKELELVIDIDPDVPRSLVGDSLRLGQILLNLGSNAVKFTDQGEIDIIVRGREAGAGEDGVLGQVVEDARHLVEEQRQVVLDAGAGDARRNILVDTRFGRVALETFAETLAEMGAALVVHREQSLGADIAPTVEAIHQLLTP